MAITDEAELRALYGEIHRGRRRRFSTGLTRIAGHSSRRRPSSSSRRRTGRTLDVSPKGDPAGSVGGRGRPAHPDRRPAGQQPDRRAAQHPEAPEVGTIFLIPGVRETLRINGTATIHAEPELLERCAHQWPAPDHRDCASAAEEAFLHCAKALLRSRLWDPATWPAERPVPTMSDMIRDHIHEDLAHESDEAMAARYATMLY